LVSRGTARILTLRYALLLTTRTNRRAPRRGGYGGSHAAEPGPDSGLAERLASHVDFRPDRRAGRDNKPMNNAHQPPRELTPFSDFFRTAPAPVAESPEPRVRAQHRGNWCAAQTRPVPAPITPVLPGSRWPRGRGCCAAPAGYLVRAGSPRRGGRNGGSVAAPIGPANPPERLSMPTQQEPAVSSAKSKIPRDSRRPQITDPFRAHND